jgi:hypothetical protein
LAISPEVTVIRVDGQTRRLALDQSLMTVKVRQGLRWKYPALTMPVWSELKIVLGDTSKGSVVMMLEWPVKPLHQLPHLQRNGAKKPLARLLHIGSY